MAKINCNAGCLEIISAACVKYTGPTILKPAIAQNTDLNTVIKVLASSAGQGGGTNPTSCAKPVTYQELSEISEAGELIAGCWYRLTDFRTVNEIYNITIDDQAWGGVSVTNTGEVNEGPVEELFLLATSATQDTFNGFAANGDQVIYSTGGYYPEIIAGYTHGMILRRKDPYFNIDLPMDWRAIVWKINNIRYYTFNAYGGSYPQNYRTITRNIYVGGGGEYQGIPIVIFTSSSPFPCHINISICIRFIVYRAEGINVVFSDVVLPSGEIENIISKNITKVGNDSGTFGNVYRPDYTLG